MARLALFIFLTNSYPIAVDKKQIVEGITTLNTTVANNSATDYDLGLNGTIVYEIADGNSEVTKHRLKLPFDNSSPLQTFERSCLKHLSLAGKVHNRSTNRGGNSGSGVGF